MDTVQARRAAVNVEHQACMMISVDDYIFSVFFDDTQSARTKDLKLITTHSEIDYGVNILHDEFVN